MPQQNPLNISQLLARYRNLYPEHISTELSGDARVDTQKFVEKVQVNIEFFDVDSSETESDR